MPDLDDAPQPGGPDEAALAIVARHALHDEELVAALAAGALEDADEADDRTRASAFVERCPACRALRDDVAAIGVAVRASAAITATAPRDFRLSVEDAHRLGGTVVTRGGLAALRRLLLGVARPVGASVAALGLVGVLVGSAVLGSAGLAQGPAAADSATTGGLAPSAAAAPSTFEVAMAPTDAPKASERTAVDVVQPPTVREDDLVPAGTAWLLGGSIGAVILGVLLFFIGVRATRHRAAGNGTD